MTAPLQPRYLILDNALHRWLFPEAFFTQHLLAQPTDVFFAAGGRFPASLKPYRGVILTGSEAAVPENRPWYAAERAIVHECLDNDIPLLGIGFGAELLSACMWGEDSVLRLPSPEIGWIRLWCERTTALFEGLPNEIVVWSRHHWGYRHDAPSLAHSLHWDEQAFQVPGRRAWGIQFHPEVGWAYGNFSGWCEQWRDRNLRIHTEGRPTAAYCRRILQSFTALSR
jgi:GMP synthase (glutamine-hydrolysing)